MSEIVVVDIGDYGGPPGPEGPAGPPGPPGPPGDGDAGTLEGLTDVDVSTREDRQVLTYDAATETWIAEDPVEGGSGSPTGTAGGDLGGSYPNPTLSIARQAEIADKASAAGLANEVALARNADNLTSGTVPDARIPATIARDAQVTAAISALSTVYQPVDSDLTAISAVSTQAYGRSLLGAASADAAKILLEVEEGGTGSADSEVTILDTFDRADVVNGNVGVTETWSRPWSTVSGWSITSNKLHKVSGYGLNLIEAQHTGVIVEAQVTSGATGEWYIVCRYINNTNYMRVGVSSGGYYMVQVIDAEAGGGARNPTTAITLATLPTPADGDILRVAVFDNGSFDVFVNDLHLFTGSDTDGLLSKWIGVAANNSTAKFDYFKVNPHSNNEGGGVSTLNELDDADTTGASTDDVLGYTGSAWQPVTLPASALSGSYTDLDDKPTMVTLSPTQAGVVSPVSGGYAVGPAIDIDPLLAADSDDLVPTQKAVKGHVTALAGGISLVYATQTLIRSMRPKVVGDYIFAPVTGPVSTGTPALSRLIYIPVWLREGTLDRIGVEVTTAAAGTVRLGVYNDNGNGKPTGAPIAEAETPQDASILGWGNQTISAVIPTMGRYYLAFANQGVAASFRMATTSDPLASPLKGTTLPGALTGGQLATYHEGGATGALPSVGTLVYTNNFTPMFVLRYSA